MINTFKWRIKSQVTICCFFLLFSALCVVRVLHSNRQWKPKNGIEWHYRAAQSQLEIFFFLNHIATIKITYDLAGQEAHRCGWFLAVTASPKKKKKKNKKATRLQFLIINHNCFRHLFESSRCWGVNLSQNTVIWNRKKWLIISG